MTVRDSVRSSKPICTSTVRTGKSVCTSHVRTSKPVCTGNVYSSKPVYINNVCTSKPVCTTDIRASTGHIILLIRRVLCFYNRTNKYNLKIILIVRFSS